MDLPKKRCKDKAFLLKQRMDMASMSGVSVRHPFTKHNQCVSVNLFTCLVCFSSRIKIKLVHVCLQFICGENFLKQQHTYITQISSPFSTEGIRSTYKPTLHVFQKENLPKSNIAMKRKTAKKRGDNSSPW